MVAEPARCPEITPVRCQHGVVGNPYQGRARAPKPFQVDILIDMDWSKSARSPVGIRADPEVCAMHVIVSRFIGAIQPVIPAPGRR